MESKREAVAAATHRILFWTFLVFAGLGLLVRLLHFGKPLYNWDGRDEMTYALVARSLLTGDLPYQAAFDHKPIALYYIFALFFSLLGYTLAAIRTMPLVAIAVTTWLLYRTVAQQSAPARRGVILAAIFFMATCASFGNGGLVSNTEILLMPVFAAWWYAALKNSLSAATRAFWLGASAALATQINYLGGFVLCTATALFLLWPGDARPKAGFRTFTIDAAWALGGFGLLTVLLLSPLIISGQTAEYFSLQQAFLSEYQARFDPAKILRSLIATAIPSGLFLGLYVSLKRHPGTAPLDRFHGALLMRAGVVFAITLCAIALPLRLYPHYFNLLVVPATLILVSLINQASDAALRMFRSLAFVVAFALVGLGLWDGGLPEHVRGNPEPHELSVLAEKIRTQTRPGDRVFLFNVEHTLYFLANVTPATRFVFRDHIFFTRFLARIHSSTAQEIDKALATRPALVMACFDNHAAEFKTTFAQRMAPEYREESLAGFAECKDLKLYRRPEQK